jgi:general nucleoside transport system ATP-binding protein
MSEPRDPPRDPALQIDAVHRRFGDCVAVELASLDLFPGEIHAVVGENGAGKSTLLKVAAGVFPPSSGVVRVFGRPLEPATPAEAIRRGVGMVHQHFMLVGAFRAIENIILGSEPVGPIGRLDRARARERISAIAAETGLSVPLDAVTDTLTVGERQRLEILRVLYRGARVLLLDEPTAVLSPLEAEELYATLTRLARGGSAIAVVTHRLDEVIRFAGRVTVMRRGRVVPVPPGADEGALTRAIMGGEPPAAFAPAPVPDGARVALRVEQLSLAGAPDRAPGARGEAAPARLRGVDLTVREGEIVGVAGVEGNGQRELCRAIAGLEPSVAGRVVVGDRDLTGRSPRARRPSLGVVHEDRHADGLLLEASVGDNLILGDLGDEAPGFDERAVIARRLDRFDVRPHDPARAAGDLSGGNQQKIVIARALDRFTEGVRAAVVLAQPTRGVDVGAAATIHAAIGAGAARGIGVLVISADLAELRRLCHRIIVLFRGAVVAELPRGASEEEIGRAMLGLGP